MPCTQKLNVLFKDGKIIEFIRSVNSTKTDHPFLMIDFKVSKDKYINTGFLIENLIYLHEITLQTVLREEDGDC